jgi:hypothetical protein
MCRERKLRSGAEPVGKFSYRIEAFDPQEALELRKRIEVLRTRRTGGERAACRKAVDSKAGLELIEQEADLCLRPDADHSDPELCTSMLDPRCQQSLEFGALKVIERQRVDNVLVRAIGCEVIHVQDQASTLGVPKAVFPEGVEVVALGGIVRIVPIADVHDLDIAWVDQLCPVHQLGERADRWVFSEQPHSLRMTDVQLVR